MHGAFRETGDKENRQQVEHTFIKPAWSVLGLTVFPWKMPDFVLTAGKTLDLGQHRNIAMQFAVQVNGLDNFGAVNFQTIVNVMKVQSGQFTRDEIENP